MLNYTSIIFGIIILLLLRKDLGIINKDFKISKNQSIVLRISGVALIVFPILTYVIELFLSK